MRRRLRKVANQRDDVLDFVGVEEAESLVDVRRDVARVELALELAVRRARPKEDADVPGPCRPGEAGALVADRHGAVEDLCDFIGNGGCAFVGRFSDCHSEDGFVNGVAGRRTGLDRKPIAVFVGEAARSGVGLRHLREDVVDEVQQAGHGAKTARNRPARPSFRPQLLNVLGGVLQHGNVGVAETVDGLLPIADDEDRRIRREPEPFAPGLDEQRHELPLCPARVLELVHENVVKTRFEAIAALRELVHLPQQLQRLLEHVGKIEDGPFLEGAAVLVERHGEHPPHPPRQHHVEIAIEREHHLLDSRRGSEDRIAMALHRVFRRVVGLVVGIDARTLARLALVGQKVPADPLEHRSNHRLRLVAQALQPANVAQKERVAWVGVRPSLQECGEPSRNRLQDVLERRRRVAADLERLQVARAAGEEAVECVTGHEPAIDERGQAISSAPDAELRQHQGDVAILARDRHQDPHRPIERGGDEPRDLGFVRELEGGIDVRLERELAKQRQAERVDRADGDVAQSIAEVEPARPIELGCGGGTAQLAQDALAHLGRRLPRERDRQDVGRIDPRLEQVDVSGDEHRCLPRAGRCLQHHVVPGVDGVKRARRHRCPARVARLPLSEVRGPWPVVRSPKRHSRGFRLQAEVRADAQKPARCLARRTARAAQPAGRGHSSPT